MQGTCDALAVEQAVGVRPRLEHAVLVRTKTPQLQTLFTSRGAEQLTRLADLVATVQQAIDAEAFYPIESSYNCAGCPFRAECREWRPVSPQERALVRRFRDEAIDDGPGPITTPKATHQQRQPEVASC